MVSYLTPPSVVNRPNDQLLPKCITYSISQIPNFKNRVERPLYKETYLPLLISPPSPLWKVTVFWLEKQNKQTNKHTHTRTHI